MLRPFAWLGRYAATGERLNLPADVFEDLMKTGHVERADIVAEVTVTDARQWVTPTVR